MNTKKWQEFAEHIQGEFVKKSFWHTPKVEKNHNGNRIVFENYTIGDETSQTCTKVSALVFPKKFFEFQIYNSSIFSSIGKYFGMQDIESGDPIFDKNYIVKSNDTYKIRQLLKNEEVKQCIERLKRINLKLSRAYGFWKSLPEGAYKLEFTIEKNIYDFEELKAYYKLITVVLDGLETIGSISKQTL